MTGSASTLDAPRPGHGLAEAELRVRLSDLPIPCLLLSPSGCIAANPPWVEITGCPEGDWIGAQWRDRLIQLLGEVSRGPLDQALDTVVHPAGATAFEVDLPTASPRQARRWRLRLIPRMGSAASGGPCLAVCIEDLTPTRQAAQDREAAESRVHYLAHHDPLTGLPNRGTFLSDAESVIADAALSGLRVALLFIDIDHFKRVNDSLGHEAGDALLKTVAQRITGALRGSDRVGRFAGDEFVVLLGGDPQTAAIEEVAAKLLTAIEQPVDWSDGRSISVTSSIGIAVYPVDSAVPAELLKQADTAATHAKARGRSRSLFFEPAMAAAAYDALVLESDLAEALREGQFELAYQPQVNHGDGALVGVEALVRWRHPQRGWVSPDEFIPLAEQRRLMVGIGQWVLTEALQQVEQWRQAGLMAVRVGVNLSAMQFQGAGLVTRIERALAASGADPCILELELTERMIMDDLPDGLLHLQALRRLGVHVALDDFGTGTTSLAQLKTLQVDRLKIDRSFVQDLPADPASAAVAEAIIRLATGLHLDVVAEGVESAAQWEWLAAHGCPRVQGHFIAQPMNGASFEAWLRERVSRAGSSPAVSSPPG